MLLLFDVDATLITTSRVGIDAMGRHGRETVGDHFDEHTVEYAGRIDPLIIRDLLLAHEIEPTRERIDAFRLGYKAHLTDLLNPLNGASPAKPCPGVPELLDAIEAIKGVTLGLLTGNFPETGAAKLTAAGIDIARFDVRVWGNDSPHDPPSRDHLPGVALQRFHERAGEPIDPSHVTIIGDTPHDVACARAHGCRALAVATGKFGVDELATADRAVPDLSATSDVVAWLMAPQAGGSEL